VEDTEQGLPFVGIRRTIAGAGVEDVVVAVLARAEVLAQVWREPLALLFLDGSHTEASAQRDYRLWAPHVAVDGVLAIHDVFPDPGAGGQAPFRVYQAALSSGRFVEFGGCGSLRLLRRALDG
jgi:predicted O-methyltransferase YrrM